MRADTKFTQGIKSGLPIALGYFPIAIAFGALAVQAQLSWIEATLMSVIVFAGVVGNCFNPCFSGCRPATHGRR